MRLLKELKKGFWKLNHDNPKEHPKDKATNSRNKKTKAVLKEEDCFLFI